MKGHPWVFSGAVESGEAAAGELVEVCDSKGEKIALGWYSPASQKLRGQTPRKPDFSGLS